MTSSPEAQKNSILRPIGRKAIKVLKMLLSMLIFIFATNEKNTSDNKDTESDGWRDGHSGYGFYIGNIRSDD